MAVTDVREVLRSDRRLGELNEQIKYIQQAQDKLSLAASMTTKTGYVVTNVHAESQTLGDLKRARAARITWIIDHHKE